MSWKTITLDLEAFGLLKKAKRARESYGDVVRRVLADEAVMDIDKNLDALFQKYDRPPVDVALLRRRQKYPPHSGRPAPWRSRPHAA
ncbi:MAG: hypothetical protein ACREFX_01955 [Opitutaceae bacterium]